MQFSFTCSAGNISRSALYNGRAFSDFKLNKEWTAVCFWTGSSLENLKPLYLEFRRVISADTITISGNLWTTSCKTIKPHYLLNQNFHYFMKSGPSTIQIYIGGDIYETFSKDHRLCVDVTINISDMLNGECRKHVPLVELSNDFGRLLDSEISCFADMTLKCGDASIPAHKAILSARSPVFAAMFRNSMKEARENEVVISDVNASVLRIMVTYVYTAKLPVLPALPASDLLIAADKYQIDDLKSACCEFLKDYISRESVLGILFLGEDHCSDLKSHAINFITDTCTKLSDLEKTEGWEYLRKERPDLAMDILTSVLKAREEKDKQYVKPFQQSIGWED